MTTLAYVCSAVALLAGVGWLIGREINRTNAEARQTQHISISRDLQSLFRAALERRGKGMQGIRLSEAPPDADATCQVEIRDGVLLCRSKSTTPQSYALSLTPVNQYGEEQAWDRVAALSQVHTREVAAMPNHLLDAEFERHYNTAWRHFNAGGAQSLRVSLGHLRSALLLWPDERASERAIALANLAHICGVVPESAAARLPRWLEGYDAAREALRLQYDSADHSEITGLRQLIHELHDNFAGASKSRRQDTRRPVPGARSPQAMKALATHDDTVRVASAL